MSDCPLQDCSCFPATHPAHASASHSPQHERLGPSKADAHTSVSMPMRTDAHILTSACPCSRVRAYLRQHAYADRCAHTLASACPCSHVRAYLHQHTHAHVCAHIHFRQHAHAHGCAHVHLRQHTHAHVCAHTNVSMPMLTCARILTLACPCSRARMHFPMLTRAHALPLAHARARISPCSRASMHDHAGKARTQACMRKGRRACFGRASSHCKHCSCSRHMMTAYAPKHTQTTYTTKCTFTHPGPCTHPCHAGGAAAPPPRNLGSPLPAALWPPPRHLPR